MPDASAPECGAPGSGSAVKAAGSQSGAVRWMRDRVRRQVRWIRSQGLQPFLEEHGLEPARRATAAFRRWRWRRAHDAASRAVPVYVVGVQRSGTNMLVRGFESLPEFETRSENDRAAFRRFQLRPNSVIRSIVAGSHHRFVVFKPLCDSHRLPELLDEMGTPSRGRAIWMYRSVDGRVRSALARFGAHNLEVLREIAAGRGLHLWQAGGLSESSLDLLRRFDYDRMTPASGAALFWYVRNRLYFDLGLAQRDDVLPVSYDALLGDPLGAARPLCAFLGLGERPELVAHITPRAPAIREPLDLDPEIRTRCAELERRLDEAREETKRWVWGSGADGGRGQATYP